MPTKLQKLHDIVRILDESVTKDEFVTSFQTVLSYVKELQATNNREFALMKSAISMMGEKMAADNSSDMTAAKKEMMDVCAKEMASMKKNMDTMSKEQMDCMKFVYDKVASIENGKDADEEKKDTAEDERNRLESLKGDERLDKSAIRGLDEELKKVSSITRIGGTGVRQRVHVADVTSECDGSNKTFSIGGTHYGVIGVFGTEFPLIYRPLIDYTIGSSSITLTDVVAAPATGQTLVIQYIK